jgi:hypothetical protein
MPEGHLELEAIGKPQRQLAIFTRHRTWTPDQLELDITLETVSGRRAVGVASLKAFE